VWTWLGPALVAVVVALFTVFVSALLSRLHDDRRWRNDAAMRLCSDVIEEVLRLDKAAFAAINLEPDADDKLSAGWESAQRTAVIASNLRMIGLTTIADACAEVRAKARKLKLPLNNYYETLLELDGLTTSEEVENENQDSVRIADLGRASDAQSELYQSAKRDYNDAVVRFLSAAQTVLGPRGAQMPEWPPELSPRASTDE
jgi:hypothetical protein